MNIYLVQECVLAGHNWGIDSDFFNKTEIHQKCTCGWKARIRDFDDGLSLYDNAANLANHFDIKPWAER
jgi:hypothetical protein